MGRERVWDDRFASSLAISLDGYELVVPMSFRPKPMENIRTSTYITRNIIKSKFSFVSPWNCVAWVLKQWNADMTAFK